MNRKARLLAWELGCVVWVCVAGSALHFAFELSDYWTPIAVVAAVNESAWEHVKMYFWPGFFFALVQYTYSRNIANNYWFGKAIAMAMTPAFIIIAYFAYMNLTQLTNSKPSLPVMLSIMVAGISIGQLASYYVLSRQPLDFLRPRHSAAILVPLIAMFSLFTYFPPRVFLFENFFCYTYTEEYGILPDYQPYRVFTADDQSVASKINYCANMSNSNPRDGDPSSLPIQARQ